MNVVGDEWSLLIVRDALLGVRRFGEFQQSLGLAKNILADRLRRLVADGVLVREGPERRPLYGLTEKGRTLAPVIIALMQWGDRWFSRGGPPVVVTDRDGQGLDLVRLTADGRTLTPADLCFQPGAGAEPTTRAFLRIMAERRVADAS